MQVEDTNDYRLGTDDPVLVLEFSVTSWCNYTCAYCCTEVQRTRPESVHAFDYHAVDAWTAAFDRVPHEFALLVRGGEPFLDHENFSRFLAHVASPERSKYVRIDTNGSWSPARYGAVPREIRNRIQLNLSYHPTQIALDRFKTRIERILEAGWSIGMINFVMESAQRNEYDEVHRYFRDTHDLFVNPNPNIYESAWMGGAPEVRTQELARLAPLLPREDLQLKTFFTTGGRDCSYPSISYQIAPNGLATRSCGPLGASDRVDFISNSAALVGLPRVVECPQSVCLCLDRYAFLEELPKRGRRTNLLKEYVDQCRAHQGAHGVPTEQK